MVMIMHTMFSTHKYIKMGSKVQSCNGAKVWCGWGVIGNQ
jgi:hypothetical protein